MASAVCEGLKTQKGNPAVSLVAHKYTPSEMSDQELEATFAARGHTVDYLVKALRNQIRSSTLSSYIVTGPRGAGKSTIIQMVDLRIRQDAELSSAWLPVLFPEEQFNMITLRDMLAATLQALVRQNTPSAQEWLDKVEAEPNEEQSEQLAITGLREITRQTRRRLVLFLENLNHLLEEHLDDKMKGTLRRLLMTDPFMLIIGSTVHLFDALKSYDKAFFNYFGQVPLDRLDSAQVLELLRLRAQYDRNERFLRELPQQQAKIRTLVHLTGGNPRFVLMLYELLSLQQVTTIVQQLKRLVDELTPLLKDEMENLPPQQRKVVHALMERGGTAQPTDLTGPTRLPLNAITTQLKRLKDAQIVEVLGGGKGRAANYTVPDKLFSLWYQMRYLGQNRRRIELFVEMLRVWFEADERIETLRRLAAAHQDSSPQALHDSATMAEYLAASLTGSAHAKDAIELCLRQWIIADIREAALAYADLARENGAGALIGEASTHLDLSDWLANLGDFENAIKALDEVISKPGCKTLELVRALVNRGYAKRKLGNIEGAMEDYTAAIELKGSPKEGIARAFIGRGAIKRQLGDLQGALADYTAVIVLGGVPKQQVAWALVNRGIIKRKLGDLQGEVSDCTEVIELNGVPNGEVARALVNRGDSKLELGETLGAIADYTTVIDLEEVPLEEITRALLNRGAAKRFLGDVQSAIADYTTVAGTKGVSEQHVAKALVNRGFLRHQLGDFLSEMADYTLAIELNGAPKEQVARALFNRAAVKRQLGDEHGLFDDLTTVIELGGAPQEIIAKAQFIRGASSIVNHPTLDAFNDLLDVIGTGIATENLMFAAAVIAIAAGGDDDRQARSEKVLQRCSTALSSMSNSLASEATLRLLNAMALPSLKDVWPKIWRGLIARIKPEVAETVRFLQPVCSVLEGKDRSLLDSLPPEQREFALEVLARFETKPATE